LPTAIYTLSLHDALPIYVIPDQPSGIIDFQVDIPADGILLQRIFIITCPPVGLPQAAVRGGLHRLVIEAVEDANGFLQDGNGLIKPANVTKESTLCSQEFTVPSFTR